MKRPVYVVVKGWAHEGEVVMGAYSSLRLAKKQFADLVAKETGDFIRLDAWSGTESETLQRWDVPGMGCASCAKEVARERSHNP